MNQVISLAIRIAFGLAAIGMLKPATLWLMHETAKQHQHGLISLSGLNRSLQGLPKKIGRQEKRLK